jgi:hypothetical protein
LERLSEFRPLERVTLPDLGDLECSGLVLVVGPNSSGKSQFLHDVFHTLSGDARELVVASEVFLNKPEYDPFVRCLETEGYLKTVFDDNGRPQLRPLTTYLGTGQAAGQIDSNQGQGWHDSFIPSTGPSKRRSEYLNYFGRFLVTGLFLDRRLTAMGQVGLIDYDTQSPQHDLHALYLDDPARQALYEEMRDSFGKAVWPCQSRGNHLCIRVSDSPEMPPAEERLSPTRMSGYRTLEQEGDGMKSYVATCVALLLGRRPVCLIDEPEMCLHPPQAYSLGRFIGARAGSESAATLVATHSSQVLRGIIQTADNVQIVRLTHDSGSFSAHLVPSDVLREAVAKPTVRAESVLDGMFAQSVVVIEGDGDRLVYQTAWETLSDELNLDVHFASVGGTGGIADTCKLYRTLRIPVAVLADLDVIADPHRIRRVLEEMAPQDRVEPLVAAARSILDSIRRLPPTVDPEIVRESLKSFIGRDLNWLQDEDVQLRSDLNSIAKQLDRMRALKRGGIPSLPDGISRAAQALVKDLETVGVFLVPVGELEEWLVGAGIEESKNNKWAWANAASLYIQSKGAQDGDVWDFVRRIGAYLTGNYCPESLIRRQ